MYEELKEDPPVARDLPPISGKIAWSRQLSKRIRDPMNYFEKHPAVFKRDESVRTIKLFNTVAATLVQFEIVYIKAWKEQVDSIKTGEHVYTKFIIYVTYVHIFNHLHMFALSISNYFMKAS